MLTKQNYTGLRCTAMLLWLVLLGAVTTAQTNVSINATGAVAAPSAILDVSSTTSGLLTPRMTETEKNGIASPVDGLFIWQTDGDIGFWYYDGTALEWVFLSRYMAGNIEMGPAPSTIVQGAGYTVTRLVDGTDELTYNLPYNIPPGITLSNAQSDGAAPLIGDYCQTEFNTCGCHHVLQFELYGGVGVGITPLIVNNASGCTTEPDAYEFYPPGHPVYQVSGDVDLCLGAVNNYSIRYRGNVATAPCGTNAYNVYIDWQQDGFFDNAQDQVVSAGPVAWTGGAQIAGALTIPAIAFSGDTYLRAMVTPNAPINSCPLGSDGETEDYQIHISCRPAPVYADVPSYCNIGDITQNTFRVSCRRINGEPRNVQNYYFQINEN